MRGGKGRDLGQSSQGEIDREVKILTKEVVGSESDGERVQVVLERDELKAKNEESRQNRESIQD